VIAEIVEALKLPEKAKVEQRVPKKTLTEHGAATGADKRSIQDGIEEVIWVAALKPANIGVPDFRDEMREYLEIAVLTIALRPEAKAARLLELVHRSIPYPVFLVSSFQDVTTISLAHKRFSEGQRDKYVLEETGAADLGSDAATNSCSRLLESLAIANVSAANLFELYQGWFYRLSAFQAAAITGSFALPATSECAISVKENLASYAKLTREIQALRSQAAKEKQLARRVEINLSIKRLEGALQELNKSLMATETA
jgi:hypothetical protein